MGSQYPLPENADRLDPGHKITGEILYYDSYRNGGEWLDAVHPTGRDGVVTGFIHAEDQYWNGQHHQTPYAFKSISLGKKCWRCSCLMSITCVQYFFPACSSDYGRSWTRKGRMLTVGQKPTTPTWAGIGDFDVVWDWQQSR